MVSNCNKFVKVNQGDTCDGIAFFNGPIATENFVLWNSGVGGMQCSGLQAGTYACIGVVGSTTTTASTPTATKGPNGISTPLPIQSGMVTNCNKFVKVNPGDTCDLVAFFNGPVATENFVIWNSGVGGMQCSGLQAGTYACVGVTGPAPTPTATTGPNGISTPLPTQPGMVTNCNKFYKVNSGDTCDAIAFFNGVSGTEWVKLWNPAVGPECKSLQVGTNACIGITGTPTTVGPNGIATPLPTQPGMVNKCNKFAMVFPGETCDIVAFYNGPISVATFVSWNAGVGGTDCRYLQGGAYACVGVTG